MTGIQKDWLWVVRLVHWVTAVVDVVVAISLWEKTQDLRFTFLYMAGLFGISPLVAVVMGVLSERGWLKQSFVVSLASFLTVAVTATIKPEFLMDHTIFFGLLAGVGFTGSVLLMNVITNSLVSEDAQVSFLSSSSVALSASYLLCPLLLSASHLILSDNVPLLFTAVIAATLALFLTIRLPIQNADTHLHVGVLAFWKNKERLILFLMSIVYGLRQGIFWAFFSVIILMLFGSIAIWGVISFGLQLTSILTSHVLKKMKSFVGLEMLLLGFGVVYSGMIVIMLANLNLTSFTLFAFVDAVFSPVLGLAFARAHHRFSSLVPFPRETITEYAILTEIGTGFGRLGSFMLLGPAFIGVANEHNVVLITLIFTLVSFVPNLFFHIMKHSKYIRLQFKTHLENY